MSDQTKIDLETVESTGGHSDKKLLDELRKRKLVEKKYATPNPADPVATADPGLSLLTNTHS